MVYLNQLSFVAFISVGVVYLRNAGNVCMRMRAALYMALTTGKKMNSLEQISPDTNLAQMQQRANDLLSVIKEKEKSISKAPKGRIKISRQGGNFHCYHVTDSKNLAGRYIPVSESELVHRLVQKEYDQKVLREMKRQLLLIDAFVARYKPESLSRLFEKIHVNRKSFIIPVQFPDKDYAARWLSDEFQGKDFDANIPEFLTAKGERVRSKSEVIIADTLLSHGVPYKYECPLLLNGGASGANRITVYPDFTCLNVRTRKEFLWEHLGRMADSEYAAKTVAKLRTYSKNGFILGKNLIVSMECENNPLSRSEVNSLVKTFLM